MARQEASRGKMVTTVMLDSKAMISQMAPLSATGKRVFKCLNQR
jgi:hypothetical protein